MNKLSITSAYPTRVAQGRYVCRRLRIAGHKDKAATVEAATSRVKVTGRALEDADDPIQDALADRDAAQEALVNSGQKARLALASRSLHAVRERPYVLIYEEGSDYYNRAALDQVSARFGQLQDRFTVHLPEEDPVRKEIVPELQAGVLTFDAAGKAVTLARNARALASSALDAAKEDFDAVLEKIYGELIAAVGKKEAERFFPKAKRNESGPPPG